MVRSEKTRLGRFENNVTLVDHVVASAAAANWYKNDNFKFWTDLSRSISLSDSFPSLLCYICYRVRSTERCRHENLYWLPVPNIKHMFSSNTTCFNINVQVILISVLPRLVYDSSDHTVFDALVSRSAHAGNARVKVADVKL